MKWPFRPQYSLATLLVVVSLSAVAAYGYSMLHRVATAQEAFDMARSGYGANEAIYRASVRLLRAELAVPFRDRETAFCGHLERMTRLEQKWRLLPWVACDGDPPAFRRDCHEKADKIMVWCDEAEQWLDEAFPIEESPPSQ